MSVFQLNSGINYNVVRPKKEQINIHDIMHGLGKEQRFGNHLDQDWSILQHVLLVTFLVERDGGTVEEQYCALHHDDPEAIFLDMPAPIKEVCRDYQKYYNRCAKVIQEKFHTPDLLDLPKKVKGWDQMSAKIESLIFSHVSPVWHNLGFEEFRNMDVDNSIADYIKHLKSKKISTLQQEYFLTHSNLQEELGL